MADKEPKRDDDGDRPMAPVGNELVMTEAGAPLPSAMTHREHHSPMTKA